MIFGITVASGKIHSACGGSGFPSLGSLTAPRNRSASSWKWSSLSWVGLVHNVARGNSGRNDNQAAYVLQVEQHAHADRLIE